MAGQNGYITLYAKDITKHVGEDIFAIRTSGFKKSPTHYYYQPHEMFALRRLRKKEPFCIGNQQRHMRMINWVKELFDVFPNDPKFAFMMHQEYSHDHPTQVSLIDEDLLDTLKAYKQNSIANNTVIIMMSDHGIKWGNIRRSIQGKYEERLPYLGVALPPWFITKYPIATRNFKRNAQRLTTPRDIYETLHDVILFGMPDSKGRKKTGISLFKKIPKNRTCADAGIIPHYCTCGRWESISIYDIIIQNAAQALVKKINEFTNEQRSLCYELHLSKLDYALKYDKEDFFNVLRNRKNVNVTMADQIYQIQVQVQPGDGIFEATVYHMVDMQIFVVLSEELSRVNSYNLQSHCILSKSPGLASYCYCKRQIAFESGVWDKRHLE